MDQSNLEISELLVAWRHGDREAWDKLIPVVYEELRIQARRQLRKERNNHTLRTTALVHEAYLKLADQHSAGWENREHFIRLASEIMRRVLVDYARGRKSEKRGGDAETVSIDSTFQIAIDNSDINLLELDAALSKLASMDPQQAKIVEVRYFAGCSIEETARVVGVSTATVKRDWASAKAWLKHELENIHKT
jgi:RNA polymerase sigma factor (TIGR02999 family)